MMLIFMAFIASINATATNIDLIIPNDSLRSLIGESDYLVYTEGEDEFNYSIIINRDSCYLRAIGEERKERSLFMVDTLESQPFLQWAFDSLPSLAKVMKPIPQEKYIIDRKLSLYDSRGKLLFVQENGAQFNGPSEDSFNDRLGTLSYFLMISSNPYLAKKYVSIPLWENDYVLWPQTKSALKNYLRVFDPTDSVFALVWGKEFILKYQGHDNYKYSIITDSDSTYTTIIGDVGGDFIVESMGKGYPIIAWGMNELPQMTEYFKSEPNKGTGLPFEIVLSIYSPDGHQLFWNKGNMTYKGPNKKKFNTNYNNLNHLTTWLILKTYFKDWDVFKLFKNPDIRVLK